MIVATVVVMVGPPGVPTTARSSPSCTTMVGVIDESMRLPGSILLGSPCTRPKMFGEPGLTEKSSISLLSSTAVEGSTNLLPKPRFRV